ncbi:hypothetical protein PEBR_14250 [Penicillium brasilianum]|uniref:N-acetyltransferase domain-containing protein n=1 Tax=Penicillium brasilianum TaxID=104259 RepID=A0A1S9RRS5_PENBI|nr:hypothetical protein PEBR_14250 [Penicillium brasilianum]
MAFHILYAEESDAPSLAKINTLSFQGRGFLSQVFPETSQEGLQAYKAIYTMKHLANPQMHVLKVADPTRGVTVGYARWHIPESLYPRTNLPVLSEQAQEAARDFLQFSPRPMNEPLYAAFRGLLEECRKKHVTEKDMMLDLLATLPAYQRLGFGSTLLRWGTAKADEWQARIYLEATGEGYPVYIKHGWKPVEEVHLDRAKYGGQGRESFVLMIREPRPIQ